MAKKGKSGVQLDLIDVLPEDAKPIIEAAKVHKELVSQRTALLAKEVAQKKFVLKMVQDAGFQRLSDGTIKFACDGWMIIVAPQDEKLTVKEE